MPRIRGGRGPSCTCRRELQVLPVLLVHICEQNVGSRDDGIGHLNAALDRLQAAQAGFGRADRVIVILVAESGRDGQTAQTSMAT